MLKYYRSAMNNFGNAQTISAGYIDTIIDAG